MKFWNFKNVATETEPENIELRIEGEIIDDDWAWLYEWADVAHANPNAFREELRQFSGKPLTVWIDSFGGSVFAATGIYNALKEHTGRVNVKIDGKAMSAATIIAMAGEKIYMSPTAIMMIHNPLTEVYGYASDLRKTADILDEVKEAIMNAYVMKTGRSRNKISSMMDDEYYMSAKTAIKEGFADEILYSEPTKEIDMRFDRKSMMNGTESAVKRMVAMQKPIKQKEDPPKTEDFLIPDGMQPADYLARFFEMKE